MTEQDILHETQNLYVVKAGNDFEIRLNGNTYATVVGKKPTLESAKTFMDKLEKYPANLKFLQ